MLDDYCLAFSDWEFVPKKLIGGSFWKAHFACVPSDPSANCAGAVDDGRGVWIWMLHGKFESFAKKPLTLSLIGVECGSQSFTSKSIRILPWSTCWVWCHFGFSCWVYSKCQFDPHDIHSISIAGDSLGRMAVAVHKVLLAELNPSSGGKLRNQRAKDGPEVPFGSGRIWYQFLYYALSILRKMRWWYQFSRGQKKLIDSENGDYMDIKSEYCRYSSRKMGDSHNPTENLQNSHGFPTKNPSPRASCVSVPGVTPRVMWLAAFLYPSDQRWDFPGKIRGESE